MYLTKEFIHVQKKVGIHSLTFGVGFHSLTKLLILPKLHKTLVEPKPFQPYHSLWVYVLYKIFNIHTTMVYWLLSQDQLNGFNCSCAEGFAGTMCETNHNDCFPYPCENGGNCTVSIHA